MRKNCFSKKKIQHPPPPRIFVYTNFFLMLEIAWNVKKTWNFEEKKFLKFYFFQYEFPTCIIYNLEKPPPPFNQ